MSKALLLAITLLLAARATATADCGDPAQNLADARALQARLQVHQSVHATFTQYQTGVSDSRWQPRTGELWLRRPHRFRIDMHEPAAESYIYDGEWLWHYDPLLAQAVRYSLGAIAEVSPLLWLQADGAQIAAGWCVQVPSEQPPADEAANLDRFVLTAHNPQQPIVSIGLRFFRDTLISVRVGDSTDREMLAVFSGHNHAERAEDDPIFEFVADEGTDIVHIDEAGVP